MATLKFFIYSYHQSHIRLLLLAILRLIIFVKRSHSLHLISVSTTCLSVGVLSAKCPLRGCGQDSITVSLPSMVLRKRYTHLSYTSIGHCFLTNIYETRIYIFESRVTAYQFIYIYIINSMTRKNKRKGKETKKRLEKQKQRIIKINKTYLTLQSSNN